MLKIAAPFRETEEVASLIEAGADELYCGYLSPEWVRRYTYFEFERKGGLMSNFSDLAELKKAVEASHRKGVPVYLTLNGLYVHQQYPLLLKIVRQLNRIELDGYIVADLGLLLTLRRQGYKKALHISTGGTVFNSQAVDFYKELGASRIILDRQMPLKSIKELCARHPDVDFEVFILNTLCVYIDGFCTFMHTYPRGPAEDLSKKGWGQEEKLGLSVAYDLETQGDACCLKYSVTGFDAVADKKLDTDRIRPTFYKQLEDGWECGACALQDIARTRVKAVKVVGRQTTAKIKLECTRFIHSCLDLLKKDRNIGRPEFIDKVQKLYRKTFGYQKRCRGNNCYHPSVLFNKK